jgi:hypothetical protein
MFQPDLMLEQIGKEAFFGCRSIQQLQLPCSVRVIMPRTFKGCLASIHEYAFAYCVAMEEIQIPSTIVQINKYAFVGCTSLQRIEFNLELEQFITDSECQTWWNNGIERISLLTGVVLSRHCVAKRYHQIQKYEWMTKVYEMIWCIPENVSMNAKVMSNIQQDEDRQEEQLLWYLKKIFLEKQNYYEGLRKAGFFLELSLWRSCLLFKESTESYTDANAQRMSCMSALSMLPIVFYGVIEFL